MMFRKHSAWIVKYLIFFTIIITTQYTSAQENCCERDMPVDITLPKEQIHDPNSIYLNNAFDSVFTREHQTLHDCPLRAYITTHADDVIGGIIQSPDYLFKGTITIDEVGGTVYGYPLERWTLKMQLIDDYRNNVISNSRS